MAKQAYYQAEGMEEEEELDDEDDESANPRDVGHNIYILAHQVKPIYILFSSHQFHIILFIGNLISHVWVSTK